MPTATRHTQKQITNNGKRNRGSGFLCESFLALNGAPFLQQRIAVILPRKAQKPFVRKGNTSAAHLHSSPKPRSRAHLHRCLIARSGYSAALALVHIKQGGCHSWQPPRITCNRLSHAAQITLAIWYNPQASNQSEASSRKLTLRLDSLRRSWRSRTPHR